MAASRLLVLGDGISMPSIMPDRGDTASARCGLDGTGVTSQDVMYEVVIGKASLSPVLLDRYCARCEGTGAGSARRRCTAVATGQ